MANETITIASRPTKSEGLIRLRFRLRDGRNVQLFHKSEIRIQVSEFFKLTPEGEKKPKFSLLDDSLPKAISREKDAMREAYQVAKDNGEVLTPERFEFLVHSVLHPDESSFVSKTFLSRFSRFVESGRRDGNFGEGRYRHYKVLLRDLERFLSINYGKELPVEGFSSDVLLEFREFLLNEYKFISKYVSLYQGAKNIPTEPRSNNTIVNKLRMLEAFFNELSDREEIGSTPFRKLGKQKRIAVMRTQYSEPFFLTREEFRSLLEKDVPERLQETKDAFLLQCAFGCRVGDYKGLSMKNVSVSEEGVPYIHYLPEKTKGSQRDNKEIETPILRFALEIIKKTGFRFRVLKYVNGQRGYNDKIRDLLQYCGIERKVAVLQEDGTNDYKPLFLVASSKLSRKTHVNLMTSVQVDLYVSGLHRRGSMAVNRYTEPTIEERFELMSIAFDEPIYKVDSNLNVIC